MPNQHDANEFLTNQTRRHQIPTTHQKTAPHVAIASCPDMKLKPIAISLKKVDLKLSMSELKSSKTGLLSGLTIAGKVNLSRLPSLMSARNDKLTHNLLV